MARKRTIKKVDRSASDQFEDWPLTRDAMRYAEDVVAGLIPAGRYVVLPCKRQLKDLKRKRWPYYFDPEESERVLSLGGDFKHVVGPLARKPFVAEPWQLFIDSCVYGWLQKSNHCRRFHEVYECVPRKNGKSFRGAVRGLIHLGLDGENGAEVYAGNISEKEANKIFKPAHMLAKRTLEYRNEVGAEVMADSIVIPMDGSKFEKLIGNPADGDNPSCALIDEYHQHPTDTIYETMKTGMGSRPNWIIWIMTTAGNTFGGACYNYQQDIQRILEGTLKDEEKFGIIYGIDEGDDWTDPQILRKANPNMGVSVDESFLLARQAEAIQLPRRQNAFKTKHLNQWTNARTAFFNQVKWRNCQNSQLKLEDFTGRECYLVADLASKSDVCSYVKLFPETKNGKLHYTAFAEHHVPEEQVLEDPTGRYKDWDTEGRLIVHEGTEISFLDLAENIKRDIKLYDCREFVFDEWRAHMLAQVIREETGIETVEYHNTTKAMSEAMKELESAHIAKRLHHDGDPVLSWMAANVTAREDANHNVFPRKEGERNVNKIDGIVAMIMGVGRFMHRDDIPDIDAFINNMVIAG